MNVTNGNELTQRQLTKKMSYQIAENGVNFREKDLFHDVKYFVPFEDISETPREVKISSKANFWFMVVSWLIFIFIGMAYIAEEQIEIYTICIWGGVAIFTMVYYFISRQKFVVFKASENSTALIFFKDRPNRIVFSEYVKHLQENKREYLKKTYLVAPIQGNSADAIQKLVALKELGALTDKEFEKLKAEVIKKAELSGLNPTTMN